MTENSQFDIAKKFENTKKCRHCQSNIPEKAKVCPICKKRQSKTWRTVGIILMILFVLGIIGNMEEEPNESKTNQTEISKESIEENVPAPITKNEEKKTDIIDFTKNDCSLKYLRHEYKENVFGEECLAVYYLFTNNSTESVAYLYTFTDKAFQNGIELEKSFFILEDEDDNSSKEIKPGYSAEVYSLYKPKDKTSLELEVTEWISLNNKVLDSMILSLE